MVVKLILCFSVVQIIFTQCATGGSIFGSVPTTLFLLLYGCFTHTRYNIHSTLDSRLILCHYLYTICYILTNILCLRWGLLQHVKIYNITFLHLHWGLCTGMSLRYLYGDTWTYNWDYVQSTLVDMNESGQNTISCQVHNTYCFSLSTNSTQSHSLLRFRTKCAQFLKLNSSKTKT